MTTAPKALITTIPLPTMPPGRGTAAVASVTTRGTLPSLVV